MKNWPALTTVSLIIVGVVFLTVRTSRQLTAPLAQTTSTSPPATSTVPPISTTETPPTNFSVAWPLVRGSERVTKKTFGTYVTPQNSPVMPERFTGYHTGWDFEIFPDELDKDVVVSAFCGGNLRLKETASGYGGVAVEECTIDGVAMTVIYGHLKLSSVSVKAGDKLAPGDRIGLLGVNKSSETDGERKHLHFDIHKGTSTNIRGYVSTADQLKDWIDPKTYLAGA